MILRFVIAFRDLSHYATCTAKFICFCSSYIVRKQMIVIIGVELPYCLWAWKKDSTDGINGLGVDLWSFVCRIVTLLVRLFVYDLYCSKWYKDILIRVREFLFIMGIQAFDVRIRRFDFPVCDKWPIYTFYSYFCQPNRLFIVNTQFDYIYFYVRDRWIIDVHCNISATGNWA